MKMKLLRSFLCTLMLLTFTSAMAEGVTMKNFTYAEKDGQALTLDVYNDPSDHRYAKKPVIIFSFGGGWEGGNRGSGHAMMTDFAEEGYIAVSIDYRLYIRQLKDSGAKLTKENFAASYAKAVQMGIEDLLDATAFVLKNAEEWGADTAKIIISGCSAGAINSATAEYLVCNDHPLATERLPKDFNYAAVVPFAGGIWLGDCPQLTWKRKPCPFIIFHGTSDELVPYNYDGVGNGAFSAYGPASYVPQLEQMEVPYYFHTYVGNTHGVAVFFDKKQVRQEAKTYLAKILWLGEKLKVNVNEARYDRPHVDRNLADTIKNMKIE